MSETMELCPTGHCEWCGDWPPRKWADDPDMAGRKLWFCGKMACVDNWARVRRERKKNPRYTEEPQR